MRKFKLNYKLILIIVLLIAITYIFLSFPIMIMPDSTEYYGYLKIFYGEESFSNWNIVRGPTLPIILYIITLLFSNSQVGLLIGAFVFYFLLIFLSGKVLKNINCKNNAIRILMYILYGIVIVFNPILIGYMHGLLTEFVAIPSSILCSFLSYKWLKSEKNWHKIILSILVVLSCVLMWFLKQPYVFIALAPVVMASLVSIYENKKLKNILYRIGVSLICIIMILVSSTIWNVILQKNCVNMNTGRDTTSFVKTAILNGNTSFSIDFYKEHYTEEYILNSNLISEENKTEIVKVLEEKSDYKSFKLINVFKNFKSREEDNIEEKLVMFSTNEEYSTADSLKMYFKIICKYPFKTLKAYTFNYLALANAVTSMRHKDANEYYPSLTDGFYFENKTIGQSIYRNENNMLWLDENHYLYDNVRNLKTDNNSPMIIRKIANNSFEFYNTIYKFITLALPIIFMALILKRKYSVNKKYKDILNLGIILTGTSLIHIIFHACTGAIIDRYGFVVFPIAVIGTLILIFNREKKDEVIVKDKYISKSSKILTIIPAYNEAENIQKVLDELKRDFPETDILVINDCSKDNTKEIVVSNNINCITTAFNLNYAYAVQTGIKYAKKYNYDYCLMFDGDGQHIAKEAKKLVDKIKESNCDIVIGSRYLEKGNYNAPKLRKIGTSFFIGLIKLSCHTKISDPLSGFQVINKRVIEKYSRMGEYPEFPDANLIIEMLLDGYNIEEVSVKMRNREFGESMHGGIIKPIKYMIVMLYTIVILILNKLFGRRK